MNRKNKIRVLKELRYLSALAKSSEKCIPTNKRDKFKINILKLRK